MTVSLADVAGRIAREFDLRFELMIALRYLRARRKDAFISITTLFTAVGVTIGVAALVVMLAVMSGFETNLRQRMLSLSPQVQVQSFGGSISDYAAIESRVDQMAGVAGSDRSASTATAIPPSSVMRATSILLPPEGSLSTVGSRDAREESQRSYKSLLSRQPHHIPATENNKICREN